MKTMAIICEYNPFHNGHKYQLNMHKEELSADGVICLMSGSFVQRGAPAIYDKWTRAKDAVQNGADLVIELPVLYSSQSAQRFATGAVKLLDMLGVVDYLSFGSECGNIESLKKCSDVLNSENFKELLEEKLKTGVSYPTARCEVIKENFSDVDINLISSPNNILSVEYLNALKSINSNIQPKTILRNHSFESASVIRKKISSNESVENDIPTPLHETYSESVYDALVSYNLMTESVEALHDICDMAEGLEYKFKKALQSSKTANSIAESVKSKRYTRTRIDRIIVNSLLKIRNEHVDIEPQYVRVLAFNKKGQEILKKVKKVSKLPIITKVADAKPDSPEFELMLRKDILSTDIYSILTNKPLGLDFTTSPIIL